MLFVKYLQIKFYDRLSRINDVSTHHRHYVKAEIQ